MSHTNRDDNFYGEFHLTKKIKSTQMKTSFIKPFNCLGLAALIISVLLISCKKDTIKNSNREKFLDVANDAHPVLTRIANTIDLQNKSGNFLPRIVKEEGIAIWTKADIFTGMKIAGHESKDTLVIIPLVLENTQYVNSLLICNVSEANVNINIVQGRYYHAYGFSKKPGYLNADWVVAMIMYYDNKLFETKEFTILDDRLFKADKASMAAKEINTSSLVLSPPPTSPPPTLTPTPQPILWVPTTCIILVGTSGSVTGTITPGCIPIVITVTDFPGSGSGTAGSGTGGYYAPPVGGTGGGSSSTYSNWPNGVCTNTTNPAPPPPGYDYPAPCASFMPVTQSPSPLQNLYDPSQPFKDLENPINVPDGPYLYNGIGVEDIPAGTPGGGISRVIGTTTNRGNTEDLTYGTNGDGTGVMYGGDLTKTNEQLFTGMEGLFWACAVFNSELRGVGDLMIEKFKTNTANTNIFTNETLNSYVSSSAKMITFLKDFGNRLKSKLISTNGNINSVQTIQMEDIRPIFNGLHNKFHGLQILINDTELTEIQLDRYELSGTNTWEADITVTVYDHFGLDKHDAVEYQSWHAGFAAWWVLQHKRGFVPFKTKVVFRKRLAGNLIP